MNTTNVYLFMVTMLFLFITLAAISFEKASLLWWYALPAFLSMYALDEG